MLSEEYFLASEDVKSAKCQQFFSAVYCRRRMQRNEILLEAHLDPIAPFSASSRDIAAVGAVFWVDFGVAMGAFPPAFWRLEPVSAMLKHSHACYARRGLARPVDCPKIQNVSSHSHCLKAGAMPVCFGNAESNRQNNDSKERREVKGKEKLCELWL